MEIIGTPHQSVEFLWVTVKWKDHVSIFRSQYQNKFFMSSLFAALSSTQPSTARSALMYKCYHSINLTWNVLTTMIHKKFRVKFRQRCYWAIMGVFCLLTPFWLVPLCERILAVRKCCTHQPMMISPIKDVLTNVIWEWSCDLQRPIKMQMAAHRTE